jgi:DNA-binding MarR family transcriptional regulator
MNHMKMDNEQFREHFKSILQRRFNISDGSGLELLMTLHRVSNLSNTFDIQGQEHEMLSGPRWWLLLRLFFEEEMGNSGGLTPSFLSHSQRVSRNTISALLRGLEEQGFIQRITDPGDLRIFRIQLTPAGREIILSSAPGRIESLNRLYSVLSVNERDSLLHILDKLNQTLMNHHCPWKERSSEKGEG